MKIDYKKQLEHMKRICSDFQCDKILGNALNDFDRGHQKASKDTINDILKIINMALKGKLE